MTNTETTGTADATVAHNQARCLGPNDARLCAIRDRMRAIYARWSALEAAGEDEDEFSTPFLQDIDALELEALTTVTDDARGAAVQARFRFRQTIGRRGNEMGDHGPDSDKADGDPLEWRIAQTLEAKAHAVDPAFEVWPDHGANAAALATEAPAPRPTPPIALAT